MSLEPTRTSSPNSTGSASGSNSPPSSSFGASQADSMNSVSSSGSSMTLRDYQTEMQDYHRGLWREASWVLKEQKKPTKSSAAAAAAATSSSPELKVINP